MRALSPTAVLILIMGIFLFGSSDKPDPDAAVLGQLKKAGSDLAKPHNIEFFLYLPNEAAANTTASRMRERGFEASVEPPLGTAQWLCFAKKAIVPELSELQRLRRDFDQLTREFGGNYDGWGTGVEK